MEETDCPHIMFYLWPINRQSTELVKIGLKTTDHEVALVAFETDAASKQRTLTPPDTWSCPNWTCICSNVETTLSEGLLLLDIR